MTTVTLKIYMTDLSKRIGDLSPDKLALLAKRLSRSSRLGGSSACSLITDRAANKREPIPVLPERDYYDISHAQRRLLIIDQTEPDRLAYVQPKTVVIEGPLDVEILHRAFTTLVDRHEILRTSLPFVHGEYRQKVHPPHCVGLTFVDLRGEQDAEAILESLCQGERTTPFVMDTPPLLRAKLIQLESHRFALLITPHHLILDDCSEQIFYSELFRLYAAYCKDDDPSLPPLPLRYVDYAEWHKRLVEAGAFDVERDYFLNIFKNGIPSSSLVLDKPRPRQFSYKGDLLHFCIGRDILTALQSLCNRSTTSLFTVLFSAVAILLYGYGRRRDVVIGAVSSGRGIHPDLSDLLGFFISTLAVRTHMNPEARYLGFLHDIKDAILGALQHDQYPFDKLVEDLDMPADRSRAPLFDVLVVCQSPRDSLGMLAPGLAIDVRPQKLVRSLYDLKFEFVPSATDIEASIEYNVDLFDPDTIEVMKQRLLDILLQIAKAPESLIRELRYGFDRRIDGPETSQNVSFGISL